MKTTLNAALLASIALVAACESAPKAADPMPTAAAPAKPAAQAAAPAPAARPAAAKPAAAKPAPKDGAWTADRSAQLPGRPEDLSFKALDFTPPSAKDFRLLLKCPIGNRPKAGCGRIESLFPLSDCSCSATSQWLAIRV